MSEAGGVESIFPRLPDGKRIDLNPRGSFEVVPGEVLALRLDIDARRSIQIVGSGNGTYQFRPQVFVDILDPELPTRLIFVEGVVHDIAELEGETEIELCEVEMFHRTREGDFDEYCLSVFATDETSVFDEAGDATDLAEIAISDRIGVFGFFRVDDRNATALFALDAEVIELGGAEGFLSLKGQIVSAYDSATAFFVVDLDAGQGFVDPTSLEVQLVLATGLYSQDGERVEPEVFEVGRLVEFDGVLDLTGSEPEGLKAVIVFDRGFPEVQ